MKNIISTEERYKGHRKRLRYRLLASKKNTLLDTEILELILYAAYSRIDVKPIAQKLIGHFSSLLQIFSASADELRDAADVCDAAIAAIFAVKEVFDRILKEEVKQRPVINNWKKLLDYLKVSIGSNSTESFRMLYLNKKNNLLFDELQEVGTVDKTPLYVREVIKKALAVGASSIIICHNHPSGDPTPSSADLMITKQLSQACISIDIALIDHVVVTNTSYYSFKSHGLL